MKAKVRVKICGITTQEDAQMAAQAGADAIGIVFYEKSPRYVEDLALANDIALAVGPFVNVVGLFVDARPDFVDSVLSQVPLSTLQFHGDESSDYCEQFQRPYLKALRMREDVDLYALTKVYTSASGLLLDTYKKGVPGGTGESFNWDRVPHDLSKPIVLAGGLTADNVKQAVAAVYPAAVDVSGGVEVTKGKKDAAKIAAFLSAVALP